jgi:hypothetical protein
VAHTCNLSYSGGRDQEDLSSKSAQANSLRDPILKKNHKKRTEGVAQGIGPKFKPQYKKKSKININYITLFTFIYDQNDL